MYTTNIKYFLKPFCILNEVRNTERITMFVALTDANYFLQSKIALFWKLKNFVIRWFICALKLFEVGSFSGDQ